MNNLSNEERETVEKWQDIPGYEGYYQASDTGRIRSLDRITIRYVKGKLIRQKVRSRILSAARTGAYRTYLRVQLSKKGVSTPAYVHQLVTLTFLGTCPAGHEVHHRDRDTFNNHVSNLEYAPFFDHKSHHSKGENNGRTMLTITQVEEIRALIESRPITLDAIARMYGISRSAVKHIKVHRSWKDVPCQHP